MRNVHRWKHKLNESKRILKEVAKQGRLYTYPLGLFVILSGAASHTQLTPIVSLKSALISFLLAFIAFGPNEYYDRKIDRNLERKKITGNIVSDERIGFTVAWGSIALGIIASLFLSLTAAVSFLIFIAASVAYSVPPLRFKGRAPLDGITNGIGLFFIFALGVGLSGGTFSDIIPGAYWFSLIFAAFHGIAAIPDVKEDRKAGLRTMPVLIGKKGVLLLSQSTVILALLFENFSPLTKRMLLIMFFAPIFSSFTINNERKMSKMVIAGVPLCALYLIVYALTRGVI